VITKIKSNKMLTINNEMLWPDTLWGGWFHSPKPMIRWHLCKYNLEYMASWAQSTVNQIKNVELRHQHQHLSGSLNWIVVWSSRVTLIQSTHQNQHKNGSLTTNQGFTMVSW